MTIDYETARLFEASNFDAYDSGPDRYGKVLRTAAEEHGVALSDVLAVAHDMNLWAVTTAGVFSAGLKGMFTKRVEVGELIPFAEITSIRQEPSGPHSGRIVLEGGAGTLAKIDFSAAGPRNTPQIAAGYREHFFEVLKATASRAA